MALNILGLASAAPQHALDQQEIAEHVLPLSADSPEHERILKIIYRKSQVKTRGSVLAEDPSGRMTYDFYARRTGTADPGPTTSARMAKFEQHASPLAIRVARRAIQRADLSPQEITHLITVSCTGFYAPGLDSQLVEGLSLPRTVERVQIGFMGCHAVLNALRVASAIASATPQARILIVSVELCSLHFQYGWDADRVVSNSLFADGAGALVAQFAEHSTATPQGWTMTRGGSCLLPESAEAMTWRIGDHGFHMTLSAQIPDLIQAHLGAFMDRWLGEQDLARQDVATWAIHPGGPRILDAAEHALGLNRESTAVSRRVLAEHGNMSSATMVFLLEQLVDSGAERPCVALGFGPGLTFEVALFQ